MSVIRRVSTALILAAFLAAVWYGLPESNLAAQAEGGAEFVGTVVSVDLSSGRFAVKKDDGGSRFTFVANEKTHFDGGANAMKDLKKDDRVAVRYQRQGSQYVALNVTLTK